MSQRPSPNDAAAVTVSDDKLLNAVRLIHRALKYLQPLAPEACDRARRQRDLLLAELEKLRQDLPLSFVQPPRVVQPPASRSLRRRTAVSVSQGDVRMVDLGEGAKPAEKGNEDDANGVVELSTNRAHEEPHIPGPKVTCSIYAGFLLPLTT